MRNTGWYVPYWRKPKKKGKADKPGAEATARSDEQLEIVRQRWVERHRRTVRALATLGLSIGSNRSDVQAGYDRVRAARVAPAREVEDAYRYLLRVLPSGERRKRRPQGSETGETTPRATAEVAEAAIMTHDAPEMVVAADVVDGSPGEPDTDMDTDTRMSLEDAGITADLPDEDDPYDEAEVGDGAFDDVRPVADGPVNHREQEAEGVDGSRDARG